MLSYEEQKKLFADEFGFEPVTAEVQPPSKPAELIDFNTQKKLFSEEFGYEPDIEEPPEPSVVRKPIEPPQQPQQPIPEEPVEQQELFDTPQAAPQEDAPKTFGVTRDFGEPPASQKQKATVPNQILLPQLSEDPKIAAIESRFISIDDPEAKAVQLSLLPPDRGKKLLNQLPKEEQQKIVEASKNIETAMPFDIEAFALGILESTPIPTFFPEEAKEKLRETRERSPITSAAGQIAGTIGQAVVGANTIGGVLSKTAIGKSPLLKNALTRLATSGAIAAEQNIGRKDIGEAIGDVAQQAGGGLVSIVPEILAPPGVAQLIAQPLGDLIYDVAAGKVRGQDIGSKDWWKNEVISLASSAGFAIRDVASGKTFELEQATQREELGKLLKRNKDADLQILTPKEREARIGEMVSEDIAKHKTPSRSTVIEPESVEFKKETLPSGMEITRNIRQPPTETDLATTIDGGDVASKEITTAIQEADRVYTPKFKKLFGEINTIDDFKENDFSKNPMTAVGYRYGKAPSSEKSYNTRDNKYEDGISMASVAGGKESRLFATMEAKENRKKHYYKGKIIGFGGDGEPLFKNATEISKKEYDSNVGLEENKLALLQLFVNKYVDAKFLNSRGYSGYDIVEKEQKKIIENFINSGAFDIKKPTTIDAEQSQKPYINEYERTSEPQPQPAAGDIRAENVPPDAQPKPAGEAEGAGARQEDYFTENRDLENLTPEDLNSRIDRNIEEELDRLDAIKESEQIAQDLPIRKRGLLSEAGGTAKQQVRLPDTDPNIKKAQEIFDKQDADVEKKFHKSIRDRIRGAIDYFGEGFVDRSYYAKRLLGNTPDAQNAIGKLNASKGASNEAKIQYDDAEKEISKNLPHELETLTNRYLQARRILEIETVKGEGEIRHVGGMTKAEAEAIVNGINNLKPEQSKAITTAADRYWKTMNDQLRQLKDNGLIDDKSFKTLSEQGRYYSPRKFIQHIDPETSMVTPGGKKLSVSDSGIKKLEEGSEQAMVNNWRLLLSEVVVRTQSRIFKNNATSALGKYVEKNPDNIFDAKIEEKEADLPAGMERISYMENGKKKSILISEKFARSWSQSDQAMNQSLANVLNIASGAFVVKPLATGVLAPEFALSNIPRDIALQWLSTKEYSRLAPVAIAQNVRNVLRVFKDAWTGEGRYRDYVAQGGGMEFLTDQGTMLLKDPNKPFTAGNERGKQVFRALNKLQETSERLTRLALREQAIRNGKSPEEATRIAREYLDFSQGGSWTKALNNAIPYLNASFQGTRSVARGFKNNPVETTFKVIQLMAMGAGLAYYSNSDDERRKSWDKISDREKATRWNFPWSMKYKNREGDELNIYFSIPKDQSSRFFAMLGEIMTERKMGVIDGETAWNKISMTIDDLNPIDLLGLVPPSISAIMGYALNKDFWTRDDIWKGQKVSPHMEYYSSTPTALKDMTKLLNGAGLEVSPARLHKGLTKVFPANPVTALMGMAYDEAKSAITGEEELKLNKTVKEKLVRLPGVRKYFRTTYPTRTDYEKMVKDLSKYNVSLYNDQGKRKTEVMLKHEIERSEKRLNDIKQRHNNEAAIFSELFRKKNMSAAAEKWKELRIDALKTLGEKEVKRIDNRIESRLKRGAGSPYKELITQ